ncbi:MAG: hypothetical protein ACI89L_001126 [Phycisphaerales bacterium]|jgi:hypothetical protein
MSTLWRVALPWKFWGGLSMQARVRPWVAAVAMLLVLLPMHLVVNAHETSRLIQNEMGLMVNWGLRRGFVPAPLDQTAAWPIAASVAGAPVVRPSVTVTQPIPGFGMGSPVPPVAAVPTLTTAVVLTTTTSTIPWWAVSAGTMLASWVGLLALLPTTRALTKLRWAHVARSAVYSTAGVVVLIEVARLLTYHEPSGTYEIPGFVFGEIAVWLTVWWGCAVTLGWKMKHGVAVAGLLAIASLLAGVTAGVIFDSTILMGLF